MKDTIAESPSRPDPGETFKSLSYLDQIALVCLAAGCHDCRAPDCLQYRSKLERVVPVCRSWPGLRDWVLCITSCVSRTASDIDIWRKFPPNIMYVRFSNSWDDRIEDLLPRFRNHITACFALAVAERTLEVDNLVGTDKSGLTGHPRPPSMRCDVSSRRCPHFTPEVLTCRRRASLTAH